MAEAVQHPRAPAQRRDGRAVLLLIEEEARLLAVLHVHEEAHAVFRHLHPVGHLAAQQAGGLLHALQPSHGNVAALPDARGLNDLHQQIAEHVLDALNAQRQRLHHQHRAELVHHQSGQKVGLGIDQPAGLGIAQELSILPRVADAPFKERPVAGLVIARQNAQADLGLGIVKAPADKLAAKIAHVHDVAVFERAVHLLDLRRVNPRMSSAHPGLPGLSQSDLSHIFSSVPSVDGGASSPATATPTVPRLKSSI